MNLSINDSNYSNYRQIFEIISNNIWSWQKSEFDSLPEEANPINVLIQFEKQSKTLGPQSLKEGLRDFISSLKHYPANISESINTDLQKNNLPCIRQLQAIINDTIIKILKRKKIKTIDEFYTVKEIVINGNNEANETDRKILSDLMDKFEFSKD